MKNDYEKAVDTLMKDVKALRADVQDVIAAIKAKVGSRADDASASVQESAAHGFEQVRDAADAIGRRYRDGVKSCAAKIEQRPFASLLAALGAGVILGALMKWHRR
jgi:ElaB/YqjD/DUF883 family membrane-anchored ribosome-binding protein